MGVIQETGMAILSLLLSISAILVEFPLERPFKKVLFLLWDLICAPSFRLIFMGWMLTTPPGVLQPKWLHRPAQRSHMGRVHLWVLPGKSGVPGSGQHVPVGPLDIVAASRGKRLFVHAVYKGNLNPKIEWGSLVWRENSV